MKSVRKTEIMSGDGNTIKIWAHRGAVNCAPENTLGLNADCKDGERIRDE